MPEPSEKNFSKKIVGPKKEAEDLEAKAAKQAKMDKDLAAMAEKARQEMIAKQEKLDAEKTIKHVWTREDTYASLAFQYYGSIKEPYWRLIYEHNKAIIGNHPNDIRVGLEIEIPPLPEELKPKK